MVKLCKCAMRGMAIELIPTLKDHRQYECKTCGVPESNINYTMDLIQKNWANGGPGFQDFGDYS